MRHRAGLTGTVSLFIAALFAGCDSTQEAPARAETTQKAPTRADITQEVVAEATVMAVNATTREIELKQGDGSRVVVFCGPDVRNFDQIKVGQAVKAKYKESLSARLLGPDEAETDAEIRLAASRAAVGEKPAGSVGATVAVTVRVQSVDLKQHLVVFTDPEGQLHAVRAERDEGRRFVAGLKPGDRVELSFGQSLALTVE